MTDRTVIFHLSDIHFGLADDRALDWVKQEIAETRPAAVGPGLAFGPRLDQRMVTGDEDLRAAR